MCDRIATKIEEKNEYYLKGYVGKYKKSKHRYKGYDAYTETYDEPQGNIGRPQFILIKEDTKDIRKVSDGEEWLELMDRLCLKKYFR